MRDKLRKLVEKIDDIRSSAHEMHVSGFFESEFVLYDVPEFLKYNR